MKYGFYGTPFGMSCLAFSSNGLAGLVFETEFNNALHSLKSRFPKTEWEYDQKEADKLGKSIFEEGKIPAFDLQGTDFQLSVWNALLNVPKGQTTTYSEIALEIGKPKAVRAVGTAIGENPIAWLIPCHRVLRKDGGIGGYRWGTELKRRILDSEN